MTLPPTPWAKSSSAPVWDGTGRLQFMNTRFLLKLLGTSAHSFIYTVGCVAIWSHAFERWPFLVHVLVGAVLVVLLVRQLWGGWGARKPRPIR